MIDLYSYTIENIFQFLGVIFSFIYVVLSIRQNIWCWAALIVASLFNLYAYFLIHLPLQSIMQFFFIITGFYGWYKWRAKQQNNILKVSSWSVKKHAVWITTGLVITYLISTGLVQFNNITLLESHYPFLDALMFIFNIIPMYLTGKKILECWIYFIVIDIISGVFYLQTGEFFFCFLFFCYIGFATKGYITWKKEIT